MKLKPGIVVGFGAKIWIQLVEKGEIKNKFSIPYPIMYNPEKRQLHSLSIVDFRDFQCSRLFLGTPSTDWVEHLNQRKTCFLLPLNKQRD